MNRSFIQIFGIKRWHRCMFELPMFECYPPTHSNIGHSKIGGRTSVAKVAEVSLFQFAKAPTKMYDYTLHRKVRWNLSVHVSLNYIFFVPFRTCVFEVDFYWEINWKLSQPVLNVKWNNGIGSWNDLHVSVCQSVDCFWYYQFFLIILFDSCKQSLEPLWDVSKTQFSHILTFFLFLSSFISNL